MSYQKAIDVLPVDVIEEIQKYMNGGMIYIPKKSDEKRAWGEGTGTREQLRGRNEDIYRDFLAGSSYQELAQRYFLTVKSIQRIIRQVKV